MAKTDDSTSLAGKLLIASPGMEDTRFQGSVVMVCAHSEEGAMGLILNMPTPEISMENLLDQLGVPMAQSSKQIKVHFGGPVETGRGFVLHTNDYSTDVATLDVDSNFAMTASTEILEKLGQGEGPSQAMLMLGYSGWGPGQLEQELKQNGWLVVESDATLVFGQDADRKWQAALAKLGVDPILLSATGGRA